MDNNSQALLSINDTQERFLNSFLSHARKNDFDKKIDLIHQGTKRYLKLGKTRILVNLSDKDLRELHRLGYIVIYSSPPSILFLHKITELKPKALEVSSSQRQVFRVNLIQVYAWLIASLLAALFALFLLWLTFQQILAKSISTTVASAILTMVTSLLSGVFFKNYDKANDRLKVQSTKDIQDKKHNQEISNKRNSTL
jgi:hypothetical protein